LTYLDCIFLSKINNFSETSFIHFFVLSTSYTASSINTFGITSFALRSFNLLSKHFKKHVDECVYRKVRCKDCYWFGTFNLRSYHDCVNNPSAIPKYVTEKGY